MARDRLMRRASLILIVGAVVFMLGGIIVAAVARALR